METSTSIRCIEPYEWCGLLVFDDPSVGLDKEPFVQGIPEILRTLCQVVGIKDYKKGFKLLFSDESFVGYHVKANKLHSQDGGHWYELKGMEGWLCPALFKYFNHAPEHIYIKVENK